MERRGERRAGHLIAGLALTALGTIGLWANMENARNYQFREQQAINMTRVLPPKPTDYEYNQAVIRIGAYEDAQDHAALHPDSFAGEWITRPSIVTEQKGYQQTRADYQINEVVMELRDTTHAGVIRSRIYGILIALGTSIGVSREGNAFAKAWEKRKQRKDQEKFTAAEEARKRLAA